MSCLLPDPLGEGAAPADCPGLALGDGSPVSEASGGHVSPLNTQSSNDCASGAKSVGQLLSQSMRPGRPQIKNGLMYGKLQPPFLRWNLTSVNSSTSVSEEVRAKATLSASSFNSGAGCPSRPMKNTGTLIGRAVPLSRATMQILLALVR